ncbi:MAG: putative double-glycine peptidase [Bradyrhizobium sp.]|jgi:predicted double-glycine peptidase
MTTLIPPWRLLGCTLLCLHSVAAAAPRIVTSLLELRQQHVIVQKFDLSCGAAALATLLRFQHGEPVTERDVATGLMRRSDYIDDPGLIRRREGFSLLDLKRYAQSRGYDGLGFGNLGLEDLMRDAPLMVPVNLHGYNHFVIFRGSVNHRAVLADPAWGNRSMPLDEFLRAWIDFPQLGRIGFLIRRRDGQPATDNLLALPPESSR